MKKFWTLLFSTLAVSAAFAAPAPTVDTCGYPSANTTAFPLASTAFNEYIDMLGGGLNATNTAVVAFYGDEHALTLGISQVDEKTHTGTTVFEPGTVAPLIESGVNAFQTIGSPYVAIGITDHYALDGYGRPLWPVLFITDQTGCTGSACNAGDWQTGNGHPFAPTAVYGTWKSSTSLWDTTKTPNTVTYTPGADPTGNANYTHLPDAPPANTNNDKQYSAEIVWNLASLPLAVGHTYRFQFMVHDGDQNQAGGDVGEACTNNVPGPTPECLKTTGDMPPVQLQPGTGATCVCPANTLYPFQPPATTHSGKTYCTSDHG